MKEYSIQAFSKRSGVSMDRLRHYERECLLTPVRGENNRYRYYTDRDLVDLQTICYMRSLDYPLRDIPFSLHKCRPDAVEARIEERIRFLEKQKEFIEQHLHMLRMIRARIPEMSSGEMLCREWNIQPRYILNYDDALTAGRSDLIAEWMEYMPFVSSSFIIRKADFDPRADEMPVSIGLQMVQYHRQELHISCDEPVFEVPFAAGVRAFIYMRDPVHPAGKDFASILDYMLQVGLRPTGDWMYGVRGIDIDASGKLYFVRVLVPAEPVSI